MARQKGTQNLDHAQTKATLAQGMLRAVLRDGAAVSLHGLAREAGVSIPTVKHYFADRSGAIAEGLRTVAQGNLQYFAALADPGPLRLRASLLKMSLDLVEAWTVFGVGRVFSAGLSAGLDDARAGPGYLDGVLEPTLAAIEARLRVHATRRETRFAPDDVKAIRYAALSLASPVLLALLHQHALSGTTCRALDLNDFAAHHLDGFLASHGRPAARSGVSAKAGPTTRTARPPTRR